MKFVGKCQDCDEQKIIGKSSMRCRSCLWKWFVDTYNDPIGHITDDEAWYVFATTPKEGESSSDLAR